MRVAGSSPVVRSSSAAPSGAAEARFCPRCRKHHFATKVEARAAVAGYIDRYNRVRRHSSCEMKPPIDYEAILAARAVETDTDEEAA
jgi:transposase InsO family protein